MSEINNVIEQVYHRGAVAREQKELDAVRSEMKQCVVGEVGDVLDANIEKYSTMDKDDLKKTLELDHSLVNDVFRDAEGNEIEIGLDFDTNKRKMEFKIDYIVMTAMSIKHQREIDAAQTKFNSDVEQFNSDVQSLTSSMVANYSEMADNLQIRINNEKDHATKMKMIRTQRQIRSASTLADFFTLIDKHPTVVTNTMMEFKSPSDVNRVLAKYNRVTDGKVTPVFGKHFADAMGKFETEYIHKDRYTTPVGLFGFIIVRYFAMSGINEETKTFHVFLGSIISKIIQNDIPEDVQLSFIDKVVELLEKYSN